MAKKNNNKSKAEVAEEEKELEAQIKAEEEDQIKAKEETQVKAKEKDPMFVVISSSLGGKNNKIFYHKDEVVADELNEAPAVLVEKGFLKKK